MTLRSFSFVDEHEHSDCSWLREEIIHYDLERGTEAQMNTQLPVLICTHVGVLEFIRVYCGIITGQQHSNTSWYRVTSLKERSCPIKELSHTALRETWPTRCAKTNPVIRGCHRFEVKMLSSLSFRQLPQQSTGDGSTLISVCLESTKISMQLPVRFILKWKYIPVFKGSSKSVSLSR